MDHEEASQQLVVRGAGEIKRAERSNGVEYNSSVQGILDDFRKQAQRLVSAQIQLHQRQSISHEQLLSVFQAYADAQVAIQANTEQRIQAALTQCSADADENARGLLDDRLDSLRDDIESGLQITLHDAESDAMKRVLAAADTLRPQMEKFVQKLFETNKSEARDSLRERLDTLLATAEQRLQSVTTTAIVTRCDEQMQLLRAMEEQLETTLVTQTSDVHGILAARFAEHTKCVIEEVRVLAVRDASAHIGEQVATVETKLLTQLRNEIAAFQSRPSTERTVEAHVADAVRDAMEGMQKSIDARIAQIYSQTVELAAAAATDLVRQNAAIDIDNPGKINPVLATAMTEMIEVAVARMMRGRANHAKTRPRQHENQSIVAVPTLGAAPQAQPTATGAHDSNTLGGNTAIVAAPAPAAPVNQQQVAAMVQQALQSIVAVPTLSAATRAKQTSFGTKGVLGVETDAGRSQRLHQAAAVMQQALSVVQCTSAASTQALSASHDASDLGKIMATVVSQTKSELESIDRVQQDLAKAQQQAKEKRKAKSDLLKGKLSCEARRSLQTLENSFQVESDY